MLYSFKSKKSGFRIKVISLFLFQIIVPFMMLGQENNRIGFAAALYFSQDRIEKENYENRLANLEYTEETALKQGHSVGAFCEFDWNKSLFTRIGLNHKTTRHIFVTRKWSKFFEDAIYENEVRVKWVELPINVGVNWQNKNQKNLKMIAGIGLSVQVETKTKSKGNVIFNNTEDDFVISDNDVSKLASAMRIFGGVVYTKLKGCHLGIDVYLQKNNQEVEVNKTRSTAGQVFEIGLTFRALIIN